MPPVPPQKRLFQRVSRYLAINVAKIAVMLSISIFIAVVVLNLGGYVDNIVRGQISDTIGEIARQLMAKGTPDADRVQILKRTEWNMEEYSGLHAPFLFRCAEWWYHAILFDWETSSYVYTINTSPPTDDLRTLIAERLSITLLLAGSSNLILFVIIILFSLSLSRKNGTWIDKLMRALSPLSAAPNWVYGIIFIAIFALGLGILPAGNMADGQPNVSIAGGWLYLVRYAQTKLEFFFNVAKHMVLPILSIFMATFFQGVFVWRTFFLIYSDEDYVEMAKAKGLPARLLERRYILRPTLPPVLTNLAMMLVSFWEGVIALEVIFNWPGIGLLFYNTGIQASSIQLSIVVVFAYLLAISVLLLEIAYVLVDPRIGMTSNNMKMGKIARKTLRPKFALANKFKIEPITNARLNIQEHHKNKRQKGLAEWLKPMQDALQPVRTVVKELCQTVSGRLGFSIILFLFVLAMAGIIVNWTGLEQTSYAPPFAVPKWVNWFRKVDLPESISLDTVDGTAQKTIETKEDGTNEIKIEFVFDFPYAEFPDSVFVIVNTQYQEIRPRMNMVWLRPDGSQVELVDGVITHNTYSLFDVLADKNKTLWGSGRGVYPPMKTLFEDKSQKESIPLQGTYILRITGTGFEPDKNFDVHLLIPGKVYGVAGTDGQGADMALLILSSTPLTLLYGILGAVGVNLGAMLLAALAATFGGLVDNIIQRLTEIKILLPTLPLVLMIAFLYTNNTWAIMGILILINIFGSVLKEYRAVFLQAKESIYVEAAQAYGASRMRVISHYLLPRIITMLIPQLVIGIPAYSFLQATLTFLMSGSMSLLGRGMTGGLTWGSLLANSLAGIAYGGSIHLLLEPAIFLFLIGFGFALIGFNLETILNPRLRKY